MNAIDTMEITIPRWRPATVNELMRSVRGRIRLKKSDREIVGGYSLRAGIPETRCRRRVSLRITLGPRNKQVDPDAIWKSLLDALVQARLLVDDSPRWCVLGDVTYYRHHELSTTIVLEDVPE